MAQQPNSSVHYTGPSVRDMIASHTLAQEIINRHMDPCPVLEPSELVLLRHFVNDPSKKDEILRDCNMLDEAGGMLGNGAQRYGSLAGYVVARHGNVEPPPAMTQGEIEMLKEWFENGVPEERMGGAKPTGKA